MPPDPPSWTRALDGLLGCPPPTWTQMEAGAGGPWARSQGELSCGAGSGNKRYLHQIMDKVSCYSINLCNNDCGREKGVMETHRVGRK